MALPQGRDGAGAIWRQPSRVAVLPPSGAVAIGLAAIAMLHDFGLHLAGPQTAELVRELDLGRVAIMALFVLSGLDAMIAVGQLLPGAAWRFAAARLLELLPPFLIAVLLSWAVQWLIVTAGVARPLNFQLVDPGTIDVRCLLLNLIAVVPGATLLNLNPDNVLVPYLWAVRVELLFAGVVAACLAGGGSTRPVWLCLGVVGAAACSLAIAALGWPIRIGGVAFAPYFVFGGALAVLAHTARGARDSAGLVAAAGGIGILSRESLMSDDSLSGVQGLCLGLFITVIIAVATAGAGVARLSRGTALGRLSLPLLLNHGLAGTLAACALPGACAARVVLAVILSAVLALAAERLADAVIRPLLWEEGVLF
jgi:hypothetical protein